jgi:putative ABC transport system permease protein
MIGVALKGLAARKVRALLTAFAVVIGVSMVAGTFMLTDTMQKAFDGLFTASTAQTDAVVRGKEVVKNSTSGSNVTIPESLLAKVRALPEVGAAVGDVSPEEANVADIYGRDGEKAARESVGSSVDAANARFSPLRLKTGDWPKGRSRSSSTPAPPRTSTSRPATPSSSARSARSTRTRSAARCRSAPWTRSAWPASRPGT